MSVRLNWPKLLSAVLILTGTVVSQGVGAATSRVPAGQDMLRHSHQLNSPAWVKCMGWSKDSQQIAWRSGKTGTGNKVGTPVWLGTLDSKGGLVKRRFIAHEPGAQLKKATVKRRPRALSRAVGPLDVLMKTRGGAFFAVALRPQMGRVAVLERRGADYVPVAQIAVEGKPKRVSAWGHPSPDGRWLAVTLHIGRGRLKRAMLVVVPRGGRSRAKAASGSAP